MTAAYPPLSPLLRDLLLGRFSRRAMLCFLTMTTLIFWGLILRAEGVPISIFNWTLLHTYPIFSESKWWRHLPVLPEAVPGCDEANTKAVQLPYLTSKQPELLEQYIAAFEKVWAHRDELADA